MDAKKRFPPGQNPDDDDVSLRGDASVGSDVEVAQLYRLLVESVQDYAIFALDPEGYILTWNAGAQRFKGYEADEIIGKHFSIFYPRELAAEGFPGFELRTAANTGRFEDEGWRVRKDGTRFWANVVITSLYDESGELVGFGKVTRDLTERRHAERELRESEERFRLLVEGVRDYAIYMLDVDGRVSTWNAGAERIKGYRSEEIVGKPFSRFFPKIDVDAGKPARELAIAVDRGQYEEEGLRVRKDGTTFWASVLVTALRDRTGELVGFAKITRDLTERRAAEQRTLEDTRRVAAEEGARREAEAREDELRRLNEQLQRQALDLEMRTREAEDARRAAEEARVRADAANRVKSEFLAAMSHELRTPLNAIGGFADLLSMGVTAPVQPKQLEHLRRIKRSQEHLLRIINDILNFARIDAGRVEYRGGAVKLGAVIARVLEMIAPQAERSHLSIENRGCAPDAVAWADAPKVEQILLNLISNAVKFTDAGGTITVSCGSLADDVVMLSVRDTGGGIAAENFESIFEPFFQVGRSLTAGREGTGLGLAISRDLARAMRGDVSVTSIVGTGSEFRLTLPSAVAEATH